MNAARRVRLIAAIGTVLSLTASVASAQLTAVTSDGVTLVNDSSLNVTWVNDGSLSGPVTWSSSAAPGSAQAWVAGLNASHYGGYSDWQLPTGDGTYATNQGFQAGWGLSTNPVKNQLGWLFWNELGNQYQMLPSHLGPFINLNDAILWSANEFSPGDPEQGAWAYNVNGGLESSNFEGFTFEALAVRPGQVPLPVPEPTMLSLLALGFVGVCFMRRRIKA